jgi:DNA repair protein RecO (recombination protein O)
LAFRGSQSSTESLALVLGRVSYGDSDLIVQLFTEEQGRISALARGARKSQRRFAGSLEPMHTLKVELGAPARGDLYTLKGSHIHAVRPSIISHLERITAAGRALSWTKRATSAHVIEPELWISLNQTLNDLGECLPEDADDVAASFGLRLLELMGWGINFQCCISCGKACPSTRSAWLNPERGGLVCQACGGGPFQISAADRAALHQVAQGQSSRAPHEAVSLTIKIVERSLEAHMGWEDGGGIPSVGPRRKN